MLHFDVRFRETVKIALPLIAAHGALLVVLLPDRSAAVRPWLLIIVLALAFIFYLQGARRLERDAAKPASTLAILGVAALLRLLLLPLPPTLSDDTLRYAWDGKVVRAGSNPYLLAPEAPDLEPLRDELWEVMPHKEVPTVYPPLALMLFSAGSLLPHSLLGIKILLTLVELMGCWLLIRLAQRLGMPAARAAWYCWNPLVCLEVAGMGHVDAAVATAMVATLYWLTPGDGKISRQDVALAGGAAAAGVLFKLVPLIALPLWARHSGRPIAFLAVAASLVAALLLQVVISTEGIPPGLVTYGISWEFNGPIYEPLWRGLDAVDLDERVKSGLDALKAATDKHDFWNRFYPYVYPQLLAKLVLTGLFAVFFVSAFFHRHVVPATGFLMGSLVLCTATVYPWYLLWVLPCAALARHRAWLALSALMPLSYVPQLTGFPLFPWFYLALWLPFFVLLAVDRWELTG